MNCISKMNSILSILYYEFDQKLCKATYTNILRQQIRQHIYVRINVLLRWLYTKLSGVLEITQGNMGRISEVQPVLAFGKNNTKFLKVLLCLSVNVYLRGDKIN